MQPKSVPPALIDTLEAIAREAGRIILQIAARTTGADEKQDGSPVTEADLAAEQIILARLAEAFPQIPVVAEESVAAGRTPTLTEAHFFLVDPLDGTREFVAGHSDYTVNIALIDDGVPVAGVVHAPARGETYLGSANGACFIDETNPGERHPIKVKPSSSKVVALASRSHRTRETDDYLAAEGITDCLSVGSSLKFCMMAKGLADVYPRFGRTMEWDTAAGDAVLRAAGGSTKTINGEPLRYGNCAKHFVNPDFIARAQR
ncbi:3'(2'),5'-bisphosphate nucleotidase CysQ [Pararhizobium haloflavum]|uniref:3'(2'),5'-bisphosphate nucleotidase CysQ n=1 Tax=Pararhizobium haloflavum TaxID=2037914 RepID=UPI000C1A019A|nr:3'(2'),5'-bisphosphate nucleotidase CysQ [Pararhizobium haloflavum]